MQHCPFHNSLLHPSSWFNQQQQQQQHPAMDPYQQQQQQQQGSSDMALSPWWGFGNNNNMQMQQGGGGRGWFSQHSSCIPRMDLRDAGDKYLLHADMPGLDKNDVKVEAHDGRLSVHAQSSNRNERNEGNWYMQERCSSSFFRSFPLPPGTQQEKIKASYNNGVLEVQIPKVAGGKEGAKKAINVE